MTRPPAPPPLRPAAALRRGVDMGVALLALALCLPLLPPLVIALKLAAPGPVFHRAQRVGRHGRVFVMIKLRSMAPGSARQSPITAPGDGRIHPLGRWLRRFRIDELPQFWNVLCGDMALVGPRPEDPLIVARHYRGWMVETLAVRPGLTGPGTVFAAFQAADLVDPRDPEGSYARALLPAKLALDRAYLDRASLRGDLAYLWLTLAALCAQARGRSIDLPRAERRAAERWAARLPPLTLRPGQSVGPASPPAATLRTGPDAAPEWPARKAAR